MGELGRRFSGGLPCRMVFRCAHASAGKRADEHPSPRAPRCWEERKTPRQLSLSQECDKLSLLQSSRVFQGGLPGTAPRVCPMRETIVYKKRRIISTGPVFPTYLPIEVSKPDLPSIGSGAWPPASNLGQSRFDIILQTPGLGCRGHNPFEPWRPGMHPGILSLHPRTNHHPLHQPSLNSSKVEQNGRSRAITSARGNNFSS